MTLFNVCLENAFEVNMCETLKNITTLCLRKNKIRYVPPEFEMLKNLKKLDISDNSIECIGSLSRVHSLEELNINHNHLIVLLGSAGELKNLRKLGCRMNLLDTLPSSISKLKNLEEIDLHGNPLRMIPNYLTRSQSFFHTRDRSMKSLFGYLSSLDFSEGESVGDYNCKLMFVGDGKNFFFEYAIKHFFFFYG